MTLKIRKIISGGQTGVDRAALDLALEKHIETGGHIPKGRPAEDGRIPDRSRFWQISLTDYKELKYF